MFQKNRLLITGTLELELCMFIVGIRCSSRQYFPKLTYGTLVLKDIQFRKLCIYGKEQGKQEFWVKIRKRCSYILLLTFSIVCPTIKRVCLCLSQYFLALPDTEPVSPYYIYERVPLVPRDPGSRYSLLQPLPLLSLSQHLVLLFYLSLSEFILLAYLSVCLSKKCEHGIFFFFFFGSLLFRMSGVVLAHCR